MPLFFWLAVTVAGSSWSGPSPDLPNALEILVGAEGDQALYAFGSAGGDIGAFRSSDRGGSWQRIQGPHSADLLSVSNIWTDPYRPRRLFTAVLIQRIPSFFNSTALYRSDNGGIGWTELPLVTPPASLSVAFDPSVPDLLYVVAGGAYPTFFRSQTGGDSFGELSVPFSTALLGVAPDGSVFAAAPQQLYVSHDRGGSWTRLPTPLQLPCPGFTAMAIDPSNSARIVLGTWNATAACGEVLRSLDGGFTWSETAPLGHVTDLVIDPTHPALVYLATTESRPSAHDGRILLTGDDGAHFVDLSLPAATGANRLALAEQGRRLYAATSSGVLAHDFQRPRALPPRP